MSAHIPDFPVPRHQADATLSQAAPVSGTLYTVLATTTNVRIISIVVQCTWTVQPTPLEIVIAIDGQTITHGFANPASGGANWYEVHVDAEATAALQTMTLISTRYSRYRTFYLEGRSVKVEARITGGTVSNLSARVKYAKW